MVWGPIAIGGSIGIALLVIAVLVECRVRWDLVVGFGVLGMILYIVWSSGAWLTFLGFLALLLIYVTVLLLVGAWLKRLGGMIKTRFIAKWRAHVGIP